MLEDLRKQLRRYGLNINESTLSMVLGGLVVVIVGVLSYNFFKANRPTPDLTPTGVEEEQQGELSIPGATVALPTTHTVAAGENLWKIAEKYYSSGYNFVDVAKVNNLAQPGSIEVGQKLTIPKVEPKALTVNTALKTTVTAAKISGTSYTVAKGDDLWNIAVRAYGDGYKWTEIAKANKLVNPGLIHAGNVLSLPR